jgi:hypothetical protein
MACYTIGDQHFKTKRDCLEFTRTLLKTLGYCEIDKDNPNFNFFLSLINLHPEKDEKIGVGIEKFIVMQNVLNKKTFHMMVKRYDGSSVDFSWVTCCLLRKPSKNEDLNKALRHAISDDMINFKRGVQMMKCNLCGVEDVHYSDFHVDHVKPFREIRSAFLKVEHTAPKEFDSDPLTFATTFKGEDFEFKERWRQFHREQCELQILCAKCNRDKR